MMQQDDRIKKVSFVATLANVALQKGALLTTCGISVHCKGKYKEKAAFVFFCGQNVA